MGEQTQRVMQALANAPLPDSTKTAIRQGIEAASQEGHDALEAELSDVKARLTALEQPLTEIDEKGNDGAAS